MALEAPDPTRRPDVRLQAEHLDVYQVVKSLLRDTADRLDLTIAAEDAGAVLYVSGDTARPFLRVIRDASGETAIRLRGEPEVVFAVSNVQDLYQCAPLIRAAAGQRRGHAQFARSRGSAR